MGCNTGRKGRGVQTVGTAPEVSDSPNKPHTHCTITNGAGQGGEQQRVSIGAVREAATQPGRQARHLLQEERLHGVSGGTDDLVPEHRQVRQEGRGGGRWGERIRDISPKSVG